MLYKLLLCALNRKLLKASHEIGTKPLKCEIMRQCVSSFTSDAGIEVAALFLKRVATYGITSASILDSAHSLVPSARKLSLRVATWAVI